MLSGIIHEKNKRAKENGFTNGADNTVPNVPARNILHRQTKVGSSGSTINAEDPDDNMRCTIWCFVVSLK